ncbi:DUF5999 family protein [Nonomuraea sp. NPDC000554]|uniref:DUF5999 family protein n=1 Tax=Nonomuraea sp. NPDC000554 TaxID=3154259 RepID=UPI003327BD3A
MVGWCAPSPAPSRPWRCGRRSQSSPNETSVLTNGSQGALRGDGVVGGSGQPVATFAAWPALRPWHPATASAQHVLVAVVQTAVFFDYLKSCRCAEESSAPAGLLCNGVAVFEGTGEVLPDGRNIPDHRSLYRCAA